MNKLKALIFLLLIGTVNFNEIKSATYFVSSSEGSDHYSQQQATFQKTPWKSLAKLNSFFENLKPGDSVLLKRGDVFEGSLLLTSSGQHQKPIVISAYGEGHSPVISGWEKISSWKKHTKPGVWSANTNRNTPLNLVKLDDKIEERGRFPNNNFLEYNVAENGFIKIQTGIDPKNWESGTLVMRKNQWIIDKVTPTGYSSEGFSLEEGMRYPPKSGFGLFIQDNINTLDQEGEWYHDDEKEILYLYLPKNHPNSHEIKIGIQDHLITNKGGVQHIKIQDLCLSGANLTSIHLEKAFHIDISECTIEFAGENAVYAVDVPNIKLVKNKISMAMNNGIFLRYGTPNSLVSDNDISDIHPYFGMGRSGDGNGIGIHSISDFSVISNNRLTNIGYSGIVFNGIRTVVERNHINNFCLVKNDGGGIYTYQGSDNKPNFGRIIKENIIENGIGSISGTNMSSNVSRPQVEGIYLDDNSSGISVIGNTVSNSRRNGIHIHNGRNIDIIQNKIANCFIQLTLSDDDLGDEIKDILVVDNQFAVFSEEQTMLSISSNINNQKAMAEFKRNTYASLDGQKLLFIIKDQKENREFETRFMDIDMLNDYGIKEESPVSVTLNANKVNNENLSESVIDMKNIAINSFKNFNEACEISIGKNQTHLRFTKPFGAAYVKFPKISKENSYEISFTAHTANPHVLQFFLRLDERPWTNLSAIYPLRIYPEEKKYTITINETEDAEKVLLLIFSQESTENIHFTDFQLNTYPLQHPKLHSYLYHNPSEFDIIIQDPSKIIIPSQNPGQPVRLGPFESILLNK